MPSAVSFADRSLASASDGPEGTCDLAGLGLGSLGPSAGSACALDDEDGPP